MRLFIAFLLALFVIAFLSVPACAEDNVDSQLAELRQQLAVINAEIDYLTALKAAGMQTVPIDVALPADACSTAALGACSTSSSAAASCGARRGIFRADGHRNGPLRRLFRRIRGGCGG